MAVPNTNTFTLQDVKTELGSSSNDLVSFFSEADDSKFDPNYVGSKNSLLNFRNYGANSPPVLTEVFLGYSVSTTAGACSLSPTGTFYINSNDLASATLIYTNSAGTAIAASAYYSTGVYWRQWDADTQVFTGSFSC